MNPSRRDRRRCELRISSFLSLLFSPYLQWSCGNSNPCNAAASRCSSQSPSHLSRDTWNSRTSWEPERTNKRLSQVITKEKRKREKGKKSQSVPSSPWHRRAQRRACPPLCLPVLSTYFGIQMLMLKMGFRKDIITRVVDFLLLRMREVASLTWWRLDLSCSTSGRSWSCPQGVLCFPHRECLDPRLGPSPVALARTSAGTRNPGRTRLSPSDTLARLPRSRPGTPSCLRVFRIRPLRDVCLSLSANSFPQQPKYESGNASKTFAFLPVRKRRERGSIWFSSSCSSSLSLFAKSKLDAPSPRERTQGNGLILIPLFSLLDHVKNFKKLLKTFFYEKTRLSGNIWYTTLNQHQFLRKKFLFLALSFKVENASLFSSDIPRVDLAF